MAIVVTPNGWDQPVLGALRISAETQTDHESRTVLVYNKRIIDARYPALDSARSAEVTALVESLIEPTPQLYALDRILTNLEQTELSVPDELVCEELEFDGGGAVDPQSDNWIEGARRVKLMITLQRIADADGIEVNDRDVNERVERMASEYGMSPSDLRQRLLHNGGPFRIRNFLLAEQILEYLLDQSIVMN